jgi:hypothetical protein
MFRLYIVWSEHDGFYAGAWMGDWPANLGAFVADGLGYVAGGGSGVAAGHLADAQARLGEASDWVRECAADGA